MVNIFTPKKDADEQIFFPFGPVMGYKKLSPEFVKNMNSFYEEEPDLKDYSCLLYTSPSPRDGLLSRMPSSA